MNTDLYHLRHVGIEDVEELLWLRRDQEAFRLILRDWKEWSQDFMSEVTNFNTVIQAGGNCGMYPRFYANYFTNVITFEPDGDNFYAMKINCVGEKYRMYQLALGEREAMVHLNTSYVPNVGKHFIENKPGITKMITLDSLNLDNCDLIHLDVERYEEKVILGATKTIIKHKPVVIVERERGSKELAELGYKLHKRLRVDAVYVPK